ncbi:MAG TPA: hypothetical protein VEA40_17170 [Ramlibacter sp.]|nr:hypothetical protein [Ramlibacter sp.]
MRNTRSAKAGEPVQQPAESGLVQAVVVIAVALAALSTVLAVTLSAGIGR